jgi:hypothetical protein
MKSKNLVRAMIILSVFVVSLLGVTIAIAQAAQFIDNFNVGSQDMEANAGTPVDEDFVNDDSILGGQRDVVATFVSGNRVVVQVGAVASNAFYFSLGTISNGTAQIVYDGVDGNAAIDPDGLCLEAGCANGSGVDLTDGGFNDGIHFEVIQNDGNLPVRFRVYSGNLGGYKEFPLILPGSIPPFSHVDFKIPFSIFTDGGVGGASFDNVGAIEIFIDGSSVSGAKLAIDFFEADNFLDFGDAPASYGSVSHAPSGPRLGMNVDIEASQLYDANALGDDSNQGPIPPGDEDGVTRPPAVQWTSTSGSITVTVNGCSSPPCYLNSWIVESDVLPANFGSGEQVLNDYVIGDGEETIALTLTSSPSFPNSFFARFRICDELDQCDNPTGNAPTGEVEDYYWSFSPTAITLSNFQAHSSSTLSLLLAGGMIILALLLAVFILNRGRVRRLNQ